MPHIFFERLERRRSTQSLLGNIPTNGLSGPSSFVSSAPSSISGPYGFPLSLELPAINQGCYILIRPEPEWFKLPIPPKPQSPWNLPIWHPLNPLTQQQLLTPPYTSPSWNYLSNWPSPIINNWQTPSPYSPSWGSLGNWTSTISNYPQAPSLPSYPWNTYMDKWSKINNVRKDLLAFFREKGILSDKQSRRLLSTPFDKA